jgi:hypothetical protein
VWWLWFTTSTHRRKTYTQLTMRAAGNNEYQYFMDFRRFLLKIANKLKRKCKISVRVSTLRLAVWVRSVR